ncbi:sll7029 (plasmid) [Synechocystis sp. PCC 6803]|uniref:Sll7029 protein n=1 Tax=Synechocystis sp. (strain ATCC 27184 / PCC 6803 / Kazusa) TaxID=1111708 RepID=Q6ZEG9_SYNY3|nr:MULTISPECIES: MoxR family ATPase [unclassified Synechocystis]AGF53583.1 hypothetical protein MYO_4270 [Synechocystis sp. PCC 6803]AVP91435.1 MoxR family ATPase [Synechocystis sp. IPPAS B-1465]MBD2618937.1 MoxR family ATPase [Synechocystis sp. FACHB-898]MBD2637428.1 MoxR family ATPase [Synechocystis sp. FACHB-908]MBD2661553.1 MoxR family ATPase [Synechocystis sp. FACHB-929]
MTPVQLKNYLEQLVGNQIKTSTMIWGPPGIGKSSIVAQIAEEGKLRFIDLRLSQLAPTDLRGLPVAIPTSKTKPQTGTSAWYPPEFLPKDGAGILFLDELNMAPPAMQGVAQQLILDRRVGSYEVPTDWFIWAAGNRKEDRASVFEMPAPLANRFLHLDVQPDFESFKQYALEQKYHEQVIAFLSFRPGLIHKLDLQRPAWPSPRSWAIANGLHQVNLDVSPAVGEGCAAEFSAFVQLYKDLPDLEAIFRGQGQNIGFPTEPSSGYASTIGLAVRAKDATAGVNAFHWLTDKADSEWVQLFVTDMAGQLRRAGHLGALSIMAKKEPKLKQFMQGYQELLAI